MVGAGINKASFTSHIPFPLGCLIAMQSSGLVLYNVSTTRETMFDPSGAKAPAWHAHSGGAVVIGPANAGYLYSCISMISRATVAPVFEQVRVGDLSSTKPTHW